MRQIATFTHNDEQDARVFCDYLLTKSIKSQISNDDDGIAFWICDEDQVEQAKEEYAEFIKNPQDERYQAASKEAKQKRLAKAREEERIRRKEEELHRRMYRIPVRRVTVLLMLLSVVFTLMMNDKRSAEFVYENLFITKLWINDVGQIFSARFPSLTSIKEGEVWRAITPIFIHFSPWHILFNMLWLLNLGTQIETRERSWKLIFLVLVIAVISNVAQFYLSGVTFDNGSLKLDRHHPYFGGMSGVVFGLFGYVWMKMRFQPSMQYELHPQTVVLMMIWLVVCMTGAVGQIANTAHVAGLLVGVLWGYYSAWRQNET